MTSDIVPELRIDKRSAVPIYRQLQEQFERFIREGTWRPGDALPSETALAARFRISVMTVRQAMTQLVNKGLIYREKGRGTFVSAQPLIHPLQRLEGFSEDMQARGLPFTSHLLTYEICFPPDVIAARLGRDPGQKVLHVKRLRLVDDRPVALHDAYLTRLDIPQAELVRLGSLYRLLEQMGVRFGEAEETLEAIIADSDFASLLKVPKGAPLLQVTRVSCDQGRSPLEIVIATYRANFYRYTVKLYR